MRRIEGDRPDRGERIRKRSEKARAATRARDGGRLAVEDEIQDRLRLSARGYKKAKKKELEMGDPTSDTEEKQGKKDRM